MFMQIVKNIFRVRSAMPTMAIFAVFFGVMLCGCPTSKTGLGLVSRNTANEWDYKFRYLDGVVQGSFVANDGKTQLIYESNITDGAIEFHIYDNAGSLITTLDRVNVRDTLGGFFKCGEKYWIHAIATTAKGNFCFKVE